MKNILVTGGCGFIGSHFIDYVINNHQDYNIINLDSKTYAANDYINSKFENHKNYCFIHMDINDNEIYNVLVNNKIDYIINFAAETHVDNSLNNPVPFLKSNIQGVLNLAQSATNYKNLEKFIQISTDEVYGDLDLYSNYKFKENDKLCPKNPYSASKASAELILYSYYQTFNLPLVITRSSNNYGLRQNDEKLIPKSLKKIIEKENIELYGTGKNVRNWIDVRDNVRAIMQILLKGHTGEIFNISSNENYSNNEIINLMREILDDNLIEVKYIKDRKGHDLKYNISSNKLQKLGWTPKYRLKQYLESNLICKEKL